jgi:hypothetical protein
MVLQRDRESMSRGSRQSGLVLQHGQIEGRAGEGAQNEHPFVKNADTAYTVHDRESYLRK